MIQKIYKYIQQNNLIAKGDTVLVGVSGGADSVCLLCVLSRLYQNSSVSLRAVHINHQLRESALRDQKFTEELCRQLQIPLTVVSVDVTNYAKEHHLSTEEAARLLRYEAFDKVLEDIPARKRKIAVAHNMNDNAETVLFHLFRGTGLKGLGGIPRVRGEIIRPLLCVTRKEIETYLEENNRKFCLDETNLSDDYSRNCIRHHILPAAEEMVHGGAVKRINETARGIQEAEDYIYGEMKKAETKYVQANMKYVQTDTKHTLADAKHVQTDTKHDKADAKYTQTDTDLRFITDNAKKELHRYLLERLILEELTVVCGTAKDISAVHVSQVIDLFQMQVGKQLSLPYGCIARRDYRGILLCKKTGREVLDSAKPEIYLEKTDLENLCEAAIQLPVFTERKEGPGLVPMYKAETEKVQFFSEGLRENNNSHGKFICRLFPFDGDLKKIPREKYTKWFDYDKINTGVCFRTRKSGDYLVIDENGAGKTLKAYFINEKIPQEKRDKIILAADGSHILWVVGYRTSTGCNVSEQTKNILEIQYEV